MTAATFTKGFIGNAVLRRAKFSWVAYGLGAYAALRLMRRYGIMGKQADSAIRFIEKNLGIGRRHAHTEARAH